MQKQQYKEKEQSSEESSVKEKFEQEKANKIETAVHPRYRKVRLTHYQECGCGGDDIEIDREVPWDSPLQDGDRVTDLEESDELW